MSDFSFKPFFNINIFTPKPGLLDEFIKAQLAGAARLGDVPGLTESRLYRAEDGLRAILVARLESAEAHRDFQNSEAFKEQRTRLLPLLAEAQPGFYRLIHERKGDPFNSAA